MASDDGQLLSVAEAVSVPPLLLDTTTTTLDTVTAEMIKPIIVMILAITKGSSGEARVRFDNIVPDDARKEFTVVAHLSAGVVLNHTDLAAVWGVSPVRITAMRLFANYDVRRRAPTLDLHVTIQAHYAPLRNTLRLLRLHHRHGRRHTAAAGADARPPPVLTGPVTDQMAHMAAPDRETAAQMIATLGDTVPATWGSEWRAGINVALSDANSGGGFTIRWEVPRGMGVDGRLGILLAARFPAAFDGVLFETSRAAGAGGGGTLLLPPTDQTLVVQILAKSLASDRHGIAEVEQVSVLSVFLGDDDSESWSVPIANASSALASEVDAARAPRERTVTQVRPVRTRKRERSPSPTATSPSFTTEEPTVSPPVRKRPRVAREPDSMVLEDPPVAETTRHLPPLAETEPTQAPVASAPRRASTGGGFFATLGRFLF